MILTFLLLTGLPEIDGRGADARFDGPETAQVNQPEFLPVDQRQRSQVPGQDAVAVRIEPSVVRQHFRRRNGLPGRRRIENHFAGRFILRPDRRLGCRSRGPRFGPFETAVAERLPRLGRRPHPRSSFPPRPTDAQHWPVQPHNGQVHPGRRRPLAQTTMHR